MSLTQQNYGSENYVEYCNYNDGICMYEVTDNKRETN